MLEPYIKQRSYARGEEEAESSATALALMILVGSVLLVVALCLGIQFNFTTITQILSALLVGSNVIGMLDAEKRAQKTNFVSSIAYLIAIVITGCMYVWGGFCFN